MNVRHDAKVQVTIKAGRRIVDRYVTEARLMQASIDVWAALHGGVSGYINWHDNKGKPISTPRATFDLVNKEDILKEGEACPCGACLSKPLIN